MPSREPAVRIASVATATPPFAMEQQNAGAYLEEHFGARLTPRSRTVLRQVFAHPSVRTRHFALEDPACLVDEDPDRRVARYTRWAVDLSEKAAREALKQAGLGPADVSRLVVNTCTGYLCPGIATYLIERLGLRRDIRAHDLVGSGCGGAVAGLQMAESLQLAAPGGATLCVAVEICSATFQMSDDLSLIVSNALFSDGAAAAVLWDRPGGLELIAGGSRFAPEHRDAIRYVHKNGQLHNQLSIQLPRIVREPTAELVRRLLSANDLRAGDVRHWALHPGGEKVIASLQDALGLTDAQLAPSRAVLAEHGNISSPTVWFVLRKILDAGIAPGDWCMMLAFGAGFSVHGHLLRATPS
ncbi:MAG: type III polyketide synthase [Candidatus Brocadiia bacterium]